MDTKSFGSLKLREIVDQIVSIENDIPILRALSKVFSDRTNYKISYDQTQLRLKSLYKEIDRREDLYS
ncbi:MAG: hypothetical protein AABW83_01695 [Nanoarchaeota archaeon]